MSSSTPNINLILPVGSEHVSRQIINDNNTKIDDAFGSTNEAITALNNNITTHYIGSFSSVADLQTAMQTAIGSLSDTNPNAISFYMSVSSGVFSSSKAYVGYLFKFNANSYNVVVTEGNSVKTIRGNCNSGTWTWEELALKSELNHPQTSSSITSGGVFGNYVTGYGCKIFLPIMKAANYNITITNVNVYGMAGDKSSYMQTPAKYGNGIEIQCTEDFSGKYATFTLSVTEI